MAYNLCILKAKLTVKGKCLTSKITYLKKQPTSENFDV